MNSFALYNLATLFTTLITDGSETLFNLQLEVDNLKTDTQKMLLDLEYYRNVTELDLHHEVNVLKAHTLTIVVLSSLNRVKIELQTYQSQNKLDKVYCLNKCKEKLREYSILAYNEMNPCVNKFISDMRNFLQNFEKSMEDGKQLIADLENVSKKCNFEDVQQEEDCVKAEVDAHKARLFKLRDDFEKVKERISEDSHRILGQSSQCFEVASLSLKGRAEKVKTEAFTCIWDAEPQ